MNLDSDEYCTCDVGIFATCPVCEAAALREAMRPRQPEPTPRPRREAPSITDLALHYQKLAKEEKRK